MPADNDLKAIDAANEISRRLAEAKRLRSEGASLEEITAIEPTREEIREAILALRSTPTRTNRTAEKPKSKRLAGMSLKDLLSESL